MGVTSWIYYKLGRSAEAEKITIAFAIGLAVNVAAFVLFVLLIGPFLHFKEIAPSLIELGTLRAEKENYATTIEELKYQRDHATSEKKLSEEATDFLNSEIGKLRRELGDARKQANEKKASIAERVARDAHRDTFAQFLHEGKAMQQECFNGLTQTPKKDFLDWHDKVLAYVKTAMSSSHVIRFTDTMINIRLQFFDSKRQTASGICVDIGREIEAKLMVLREFILELNN